MKVLAIIISGLVLQTSASFFDEFRGALSSVENSFEKLLSDVVYDVKDTIDCTLMAVEQVLALGVFRDPADYYKKCGGGTEAIEQPPVALATAPPLPPLPEAPQFKTIPLTSTEHGQVDSSILNVDQVLCDVLNKDDPYTQLKNVKLALINETDRLTQISELLKKQLGNLSADVKEKFKAIELQTTEPSVESIWNEIKLLHEIEHKDKNKDEALKISHILDQISNILDANEEDRSTTDDYKVQEDTHKLSTESKGEDNHVWKDSEDYPKDFRDYAKRVFYENKATLPADNTTKKPELEDKDKEGVNKQKGERDKNAADKNHEKLKDVTTVKPERKTTPAITTTTTEKPLTIEELTSEYGSLFDIMPDVDSIETKKAVESAKNIIADAQLNEAVMTSLAGMDSKAARNLFDDPVLLGYKYEK